MKILHIDNISRSSYGITQGLNKISHVVHDVKYLNQVDLIIVSDVPSDELSNLIDKNKLWHKTIHYDYRDTLKIEEIANKCLKSFKRSIINRNNNEVIEDLYKIKHISHCALDEYYLNNFEKQYDIGCFFDINDPKHLGIRRFNLIQTLSSLNIKNSLIGKSTGKKQEARLAIFEEDKNNCFYQFLKFQSYCKIIFSAQPSHCEGDNRTWEAMASGGLVFLDKMNSYYINKLIDEKHCIFYDALDINSILEAYDKAKFYLKNEDKRLKIAINGFDFVRKYHTSIERAKQIYKSFKVFL